MVTKWVFNSVEHLASVIKEWVTCCANYNMLASNFTVDIVYRESMTHLKLKQAQNLVHACSTYKAVQCYLLMDLRSAPNPEVS